MGGFSYDRSDYDSSSSSSWSSGGSSYTPSKMTDYSGRMGARVLVDEMWADHRITSKTKTPIVILLDVTGSNTDLAKIVYNKMPMLYGQIEQKKYLDDFDVCFLAVGDAKYDDYPLQVGNFGKGIEIDSYLEKIVLEGRGGANDGESYECAAYYLTRYMDMPEGAKPIVFFIGDEKSHALDKNGVPDSRSIERCKMDYIEMQTLGNVWLDLRKMCDENVYMLLGKYQGYRWDPSTTKHWDALLEKQHVVKVDDQKAIVDIILGIIALSSNTRDLESYTVDMIDRGQTTERVSIVEKSLKGLSTELVAVKTSTDLSTVEAAVKTSSKAKRL